jgi:hypothetical protein
MKKSRFTGEQIVAFWRQAEGGVAVKGVTVNLEPMSCGAELSVVPEGSLAVVSLDRCDVGWQESLAQFATRVEPEIAQ